MPRVLKQPAYQKDNGKNIRIRLHFKDNALMTFSRQATFRFADRYSRWAAIPAALIFFAATAAHGQTNTGRAIKGKYCEDLGFGWYCVDFKNNGKCTVSGGHSYRANKSNGKWTAQSDTIVVISFANKKMPGDTTYMYFKSDTLYSLYYTGKRFERAEPFMKQE